MKFDTIIKRISGWLTIALVFLASAAVYMSAKGFAIDEKGNVILINQAKAQPQQSLAQPLDKRVVVNISNPHFWGDENAPITIYEYSSFGCSHCADFHLSTLKKLDDEFIKTGKVKIVLVPFPIERKSMQGAMVAACIPNSEYHNFVNTMFNKQREWGLSNRSEELITGYAAAYGVSKETALECMKNDSIASEILANRQQGIEELHIQGTPAFLVDDGKTQEMISGAPSYSEMKAYLTSKVSDK